MSTARGRFVVLEGLSGAGKSTIAAAVAAALPQAAVVEPITPELEPLRAAVDEWCPVDTRMHFWLAVYYGLRSRVEPLLAGGTDAILDSYVFRALATHGALGASPVPVVDWGAALVPDHAFFLRATADERARRLRLRDRGRPKTAWHRATEAHAEEIVGRYEAFGLTPVETTGIPVDVLVARILALIDGRKPAATPRSRDRRTSSG